MLRTVIREKEGQGYQYIMGQNEWQLQLIDGANYIDDAGLLQERLQQLIKKPFDLSADPLFRATLIQMGEQDHILVVVMHHIVSDGWSLSIMVKEVVELYASFIEKRTALLPQLRLQYADFAIWQRAYLQGDVLAEKLNYWKNKLEGVTPVQFPVDYALPDIKDKKGSYYYFDIDKDLSDKVQQITRQQGATLFMTLLAALKVLLYRYTGQADICIGTSIAGRQLQQVEGLIGYFINALALRTAVNADGSFEELLQKVKTTTLEAYEHQDIPYEKVVDAVITERSISNYALFQVIFVLQNTPDIPQLTFGDVQLSQEAFVQDTYKADLIYHVTETPLGLRCSIQYTADKYSSQSIESIANHYRELLRSIVTVPKQKLASLPMLNAGEAQQLLAFNHTVIAYPTDKSMVDLFEDQVLQTPLAVAVVFEQEQLTYAELNERSNQLAHYLKTQGVDPEMPVPLCIERGIEMVVGILGILKAGGAYVPIDPDYPEDRIQYILEDTGATLVVSTKATQSDLQAVGNATIIELDTALPVISSFPVTNIKAGVEPGHLAYIIYTSGSTGKPKGVSIMHQSNVNMSLDQVRQFGITATDKVLQFASISFDASVSEIFMAFYAGATLVLMRRDMIRDANNFSANLRNNGVSVVTLPPVYLKALQNDDLHFLRALITAGEAADVKQAASLSRYVDYYNAYGPTECAVCVSIYKVAPEDVSRIRIPIGKPIANTTVYILDEDQQLLPVGIQGEIYVAGAGLARGYFERAELTAEKFIPHPFEPGKKLYKTGDSGRWLTDGNLEFLGRKDDQVKIRGYRVELGEIENTLLLNKDVAQCVVVMDEAKEDKQLVAYYQAKKKITLWPSVAEFYVYDDLLYKTMAGDEARNAKYRNAFRKVVRDKIILEIGPGFEAILSRIAIKEGAKKVYAVELLEESYLKAKETVESLGLQDQIIVIHDDITKVELPEKADYCISEIVGAIGGSEGAAVLINSSRHLLNDPSHMVPTRSLTKIAAITLPAEQFDYSFEELGAYYTSKIFEEAGRKFDLRLYLSGLPAQNIISTSDVFEDLDYTQECSLESAHDIRLDFQQDGEVNGFIVWLNLYCDEEELIDTVSGKYTWLPIYFPVFDGGETVAKGDYIAAKVIRKLSANGLNPDFEVQGTLVRNSLPTVAFTYESFNSTQTFKGNDFYKKVFENDEVKISEKINKDELRDLLKKQLPDYMVPSLFMELDVFPVTISGKIDKKALPAPDAVEVAAGQYVAPRNDIEKALVEIWQDILEVENVGIHDDFFELGGHSLLAIRLISLIRRQLDIEVPIGDVFENPTIALLAGKMTNQDFGGGTAAITVQSRPEYIPLSFSQERLYFIDQLEGSIQYHVPAVLRLKGKLDSIALANALQTIVQRHEVLRTVIRQMEGKGYQHILPATNWELQMIDGEEAGYRDGSASLQQYIGQLIREPFDLSAGYMLRASLISLSKEDYILVLTLHHIASDGWSASIIIKELVELYGAYTEGRPAQLPVLQLQYADYAIWQRSYLDGEMLDSKMRYWEKKLDGTMPLQLPTDYARPAIQSVRGAVTSFRLDPELTMQLNQLGRQQGTTLFMTLVAAFQVLLHRYSRQSAICIGTPTANRGSQELEGLIGFFVNTLALRSQVSSEMAFTAFLQQVKTTTLEAFQNQDVPFEKIVDTVMQERDMSRHPLFQVMFILQNTPDVPELRLGELELLNESFALNTTKFDITFALVEKDATLQGSVEYCTDLYNEETIVRMIGHFEQLLRSVVRTPDKKINLLPLLTEKEKEKVLIEFNTTQANYPTGKTIVDLFEEQAIKSPAAIAVVQDGKQLTYGELNDRSNQLAHYLRDKGVTAETMVPVCLSRSLDMIVGIIGILKAGGAYVPIDPEYPLDRISYMLEDTNASLAITSKRDRSRLTGNQQIDVVEIDGHWPAINKYPADKIQTVAAPHQLAYVIYTSGSTGRPKGVMIEHHNVYTFICWCRQEFSASHFDILYATTSICFDLSVFEIFYPLSIGKPLRIVENGLYIGKYLPQDHFVLINTVPSVVDNLIKERTDLKHVSVINMAGEPIPSTLMQYLDTQAIEVRNLYGPTEDTTYTTIYRLQQDAPILIGKPIANTGIYILGEEQEVCPVGIAGQICITGEGLARGYLNQPALTAEKFVPNPLSTVPGARMYQTGDLGRWRPDGNIEYLGRMDSQIKMRGYRIELGEIENELQQSGLITRAVVLAKQGKTGPQSLVSYYVPDAKAVKEKEKGLFAEQVANWKAVYETEYEQPVATGEDAEFNIVGWKDSFTGGPIPREQMEEWVADIVNVIEPEQAGEVLEIGSGTGLIYYQLAGKVKKYTGTDFSRSSISQIRQRISKGLRNYGPTELQACAAHEVSLPDGERADTIIINSVVQYFPGEGYMDEVIAKAISLVKSSGRIIIGDVRDKRLLPLFKSRLQLQKLKSSVNIKDFEWAVAQEVLKEEELCFSPEYFYRLPSVYPQITHIDVQWKQGSYINELTLYRYTVVIYVGIQKELVAPQWQNWDQLSDQQTIIGQLQDSQPLIGLRNVPNPRLWQERLLDKAMVETISTSTVSDLLEAGDQKYEEKDAINRMLDIARSQGYYCHLLLNRDPLLVNMVMERNSQGNFIEQDFSSVQNDASYTNIPLFDSIGKLLQKDIRALLHERLPEYMVPSELIAIGKLPLTNNGKIDRLFLSQREEKDSVNKHTYVAPTTELEEQLAVIWQDLLGIEKIGIRDNFFELGGHSLLAMRVISATRRQLQAELAIKDIFINPTIASLAGHLQVQEKGLLLPSIGIQVRPPHIPLSFSQERLFFIDQLEGSIQYHMPVVLRLKGNLETEALVYALQTIVRRHEVLRTVIHKNEGQGYQYIMDEQWELNSIDDFKYKHNNEQLEVYIRELIKAPFDLSRDYMLRANVVTLAEQDHVLVVVMHHIAADGWSSSIIVKELIELYGAYVEGRTPFLPALEIQYADYAIWQRAYLQGEILDKRMDYWIKKLDGVALLEFPSDYPRPAVQTTHGTTLGFRLDNQLVSQLQQLSQQQGATLFMTLLSVFKILLHRYSGQEDICVGTPTANRGSIELEPLIGFFVNTLALRSEVSAELSFEGFLQQVKATTLEAYEHQDVPFEKVVDAVVKERNLNRNPLFQVMFVLQNNPKASEIRLGDVKLSPQGFNHSTSAFDMQFFITETADGIHGTAEYNTDLYRHETVLRLIGHYKELLAAVVKEPGEKIGLLPMLGKSEKQQLLVEFNNTSVSYPKEKTVVDLFEEQVLNTPESVAIVFEQEQLTYRQLNERSNRLARYLISKGVKEEMLVPVCIERSLQMMVGILGILKAGGAYVPIDPEYPMERISYMLQDIGASLIVSSRACRVKLTGAKNAAIIELDSDWEVIEKQAGENVGAAIKGDHLIYVIYTSGSTGKPKGVMIEHRSVINLLQSIAEEVGFNGSSTMLSVTTYSFDICYLELYMPLINGGKLIIIPREVAMDGHGLADSIARYHPSHMQGTPATWQILLDGGWKNKEGIKILIGGEAVSEALKESLTKNSNVWNVYGPTETTIWSTIKKLEAGQKIVIGKPIANTSIYILNSRQNLVPVGVAGEICIAGDGLARGYLNRTELTKEKFVDDPFSEEADAKMYKTGDLGKWLPDGDIEFLGRIDDQVKIRGYRIELGEIENELQHSGLINQSVVLAKQGSEGIKSLISFYVPDGKVVKQKETGLYEEQVATWKDVYETEYTYTGENGNDEEFDIGIWKDSFTGGAIPEEQMQEWVNDIVEVIRPEQAGEVLEIGCGTGLIYYRLAGKVKKYIGTDFSQSSISQIGRRIRKGLRDYGPTELQVSAAHETSLKDGERVDTIILNSIVQYFPGEGYMDEVIQKSISLLKDQGRIIIGDVRDLRLLRLFKSRLQTQKLQSSVSIKDFKWAVDQEVLKEEELLFSPGYFYRLSSIYPQITHIDIQWKHGSYINELTMYRYTVVIYVGIKKELVAPQWQNWDDTTDRQSITNQLEQSLPVIAVRDVPNPRLWQESLLDKALMEAVSTARVGDILTAAATVDEERTEISRLLQLADSKGYHYQLVINENPLLVDILLELTPSGNFIEQGNRHKGFRMNAENTNVPLFNTISLLLQKDIRAVLKENLPEYMVPSEFVALSKLPLTANGKVDRQFLSERESREVVNKFNYVAPHTELEQKLAAIWQELLGIERVGIHDNFFDLGGHSLLAMKMVAHLKKRLQITIPIQVLFQFTTISDLSNYLEWDSEASDKQDDTAYEVIKL